MKEKNIGPSFDSWLQDEGIYEEVTTNAIKRVTIRQISAKPAPPNQIEDQQKTAGRGSRSDRIMKSTRRRKEKQNG